MNFYEFVDKHPALSLFALFLICSTAIAVFDSFRRGMKS